MKMPGWLRALFCGERKYSKDQVSAIVRKRLEQDRRVRAAHYDPKLFRK